MNAIDPQTPNRLRPRYSLVTVLLVMALVACGITIWQLWREVGPLRKEVRSLRDEVGRIEIKDPTKTHVIAVRQPEELTWRWRLWIPEGRAYVLRAFGGNVPKDGFPNSGASMSFQEPGEMWVEFRIAKDSINGQWRGKMSTRTGSVGGGNQEWVEWGNRTGTGGGVGQSTEVFEPDDIVLITRQRYGKSVLSSEDIPDPAPGFMIWLEPR